MKYGMWIGKFHKACRVKIRDERGVAIVELAIIMPLLLVILFGIIDFGILLHDKAMLTNASREGARAGIVFSGSINNDGDFVPDRITPGEIVGIVESYCKAHLISFGAGSTLNVPSPEFNETARTLKVVAEYPFRFLAFSRVIPLIGGSFEDFLTLRAETVMRLE